MTHSPRSAHSTRETSASGNWPALLRIRPAWLLAGLVAWLVLAWVIFLAVDIADVGGLGSSLDWPMWHHLFNDRPVEWSAWVVLTLAVLAAGHMSGRLAGAGVPGAREFFLLLGLGLGLMLIEEMGDVRHVLSDYVERNVGEQVFGLPHQVVSDVPFFAVIAAVPLYAVLRYGWAAWRVPAVRPYLVAGVGLFGVAAIANGLRHLGDLYTRVGAWVDGALLGGRLPVAPGMTRERAQFFLLDGPVEETIELLATGCMLAVILAYAGGLRSATDEEAAAPARRESLSRS